MSWTTIPEHIRHTAQDALTTKQLQAWQLELAGWGTRTTATHLGISRRSLIDRLDNAHRALLEAGIRQHPDGTWHIEEAA